MVHNSGGSALDMSGTLQLLSGPGGLASFLRRRQLDHAVLRPEDLA